MPLNYDLSLFTTRIYEYIDYQTLSYQNKKYIDEIMFNIIDSASNTNETCTVIDFNPDQLYKYSTSYNYWLIDNILSLSFIDVFGCHNSIRRYLMQLHLFKNFNIKFDGTNSHLTTLVTKLSDLYIDLHYGVFLSGATDLYHSEKRTIVLGKKYPYKNYKQSMLSQYFNVQSSLYSKEDAEKIIYNALNMC